MEAASAAPPATSMTSAVVDTKSRALLIAKTPFLAGGRASPRSFLFFLTSCVLLPKEGRDEGPRRHGRRSPDSKHEAGDASPIWTIFRVPGVYLLRVLLRTP